MLGRKKSVKNEDWRAMHESVSDIISHSHIIALEEKAIEEIKLKTEGLKSAYAWSGGKDSLALGAICEKAGVVDCVLGRNDLEYQEFMDWIEINKPKGLTIINTGQNLEWIASNQDMLFPDNSNISSKWYKIVQHKAQEKYYKDNSLDIIILGRRKKDGNYVGKGDNIYTSKGITRYSPLSNWTHEEVSAYIYYNNIEMPPIYDWPRGYVIGTHSWASRESTGDITRDWHEIYSIDKEIVINASKYLQSARDYLEGRE